MSNPTISLCPITDQQVINTSIKDGYYQYDILYNEYTYTLKLSLELFVDKKISFDNEVKQILQGMLFNYEWPIEKETIITKGLISQLLKFGVYPRSYDDKIDYYVVKCYLNGGNENKSFTFDVNNKLDIYAYTEDEFERLFDDLKKRDLVEYNIRRKLNKANSNHLLKLTRSGVELAKKILQENPIYNLSFRNENSPKILVVSTKEDEGYAAKLISLFHKNGVSTLTIPPIEKNDKFFAAPNILELIQNDKLDYIIFIKSDNSDTNNNYGSLYDQAILSLKNSQFNYIYFAFIDDSDIQSRPGLIDFNNRATDIRIETNRKNLLSIIKQDYIQRISKNRRSITKKYNFQKIEISSDTIKWLRAIFSKNLKGEDFEYRYLLLQMSNTISKDFDPEKINPLLARGGKEITLLGIWHIDQESNIFEKVDIVIKTIQALLAKYSLKTITSETLKPIIQNITDDELIFIAKILFQMGFAMSYGKTNMGFSIDIDTNEIYKRYNQYSGLEKYINEYYFNNSQILDEKSNKKTDKTKTNKFEVTDIHLHKTQYKVRDTNDIDPVMGVLELANDLAEIIDSMPSEKGSMIGIFGKWGRGKTFLLKELWKIIRNKETKYIKIDYHAWKYQETPASWAYLYELFSEEYLGKKGIKHYYRILKLNRKRIGVWPIIKFFLLIILFTTFSLYLPHLIQEYDGVKKWYILIASYSLLGISVISLLNRLYTDFGVKATDLIKKYKVKTSFKENLGLQANIQDELIELLKVWLPENKNKKNTSILYINDLLPAYLARKVNHKIIDLDEYTPIWLQKSKVINEKIILFVEDIDRCREDNIIQNIDALRILLEDNEIAKRVIIITAIDESILKNAIEIKYKSMFNNADTTKELKIRALVSEYLDKLFISAIKLGELTVEQKSQYLNELIKQEVDRNAKIEAFDLGVSDFLKSTVKDLNLSSNAEKEILENINTKSHKDDKKNVIDDNESYVSDFSNKKISSIPMSELELNNLRNKIFEKRQIELNKFEKLTAKEIYLMDKIILQWQGATPRRIRIYYYRYLLLKNLLINKYIYQNSTNMWQNEEGIKKVMLLILHYSKLNDPDSITKIKTIVAHSENENENVEIENTIYEINRLDYLNLLEVLELVIAY